MLKKIKIKLKVARKSCTASFFEAKNCHLIILKTSMKLKLISQSFSCLKFHLIARLIAVDQLSLHERQVFAAFVILYQFTK